MKKLSTFVLILLLLDFSGSLLLLPQRAQADITSNLIAHWTFDEGTGTNAADSAGSWPGTLTGANAGWGTGQISGAVDLTGTNGYVAVGRFTPWETANTPMTIAGWVRLHSFSTAAAFISYGSNFDSRLALYDENSGNLRFEFTDDTENFQFVIENAALAVDTWAHIAVTMSATQARLYLNGSVVGWTIDHSGFKAGDSGQSLYLGRSIYTDDPERFVNSLLDDVRIYDRELTSGDVAELYAFTGESETPPRIIRLRGRVQLRGGTHLR